MLIAAPYLRHHHEGGILGALLSLIPLQTKLPRRLFTTGPQNALTTEEIISTGALILVEKDTVFSQVVLLSDRRFLRALMGSLFLLDDHVTDHTAVLELELVVAQAETRY